MTDNDKERAEHDQWFVSHYGDIWKFPKGEHRMSLNGWIAARRQPASGEPVGRVRHYDYHGIARNGHSIEAVLNEGVDLPDGALLFAAPVASGEPEGLAAAARRYMNAVNDCPDAELNFSTADAHTEYDRARFALQKALHTGPFAEKPEDLWALIRRVNGEAPPTPAAEKPDGAVIDYGTPAESEAQGDSLYVAYGDDDAVDLFAAAMKAKMAASRAKGRGGWHDPDDCPTERLQRMLVEHIAKGDPVDVGNFAMMLFNRGEGTTLPANADINENAPWLTTAHMICADQGIPSGHIKERLEVLREKLFRTPAAEKEAQGGEVSRCRCERKYGRKECGDGKCLDTTQPAAQSAVGAKRWPFVETPGEFTVRLQTAMQQFPDLLGAVRNVLIENPPTLSAAAQAQQDRQEVDKFCDGHCTWLDHHKDCPRDAPATQVGGEHG